ncbi:MAG: hypothetical protein ABJQ71_18445 [Roseibium sp.]
MGTLYNSSAAEEWSGLVSRWNEVESDLHSALEQFEPNDPMRRSKLDNAEVKLAEIKREMDELIACAKKSRDPSSPNFIIGTFDFGKFKNSRM